MLWRRHSNTNSEHRLQCVWLSKKRKSNVVELSLKISELCASSYGAVHINSSIDTHKQQAFIPIVQSTSSSSHSVPTPLLIIFYLFFCTIRSSHFLLQLLLDFIAHGLNSIHKTTHSVNAIKCNKWMTKSVI